MDAENLEITLINVFPKSLILIATFFLLTADILVRVMENLVFSMMCEIEQITIVRLMGIESVKKCQFTIQNSNNSSI